MIKKVFKNGAIYSLSNIITRGINFLLLPIYTRLLTPTDYGVMDYLTAVGNLSLIILTFEIGQGLARYLPEAKNDNNLQSTYSSTALLFSFLSHIPLIIFIGIFKENISLLLFKRTDYANLIFFVSFVYLENALISLFILKLRYKLQVKQSALLSLANGVSVIILSAIFIAGLRMGLLGAYLAKLVSGSIIIGYSIISGRKEIVFKIDWPALKKLLGFSIPLVPSSIGVIVAMYIDRAAINSLMSIEAVGIYGIGYRFASIVVLIMSGFQSSLIPLIYYNYKNPTTPFAIAETFRIFSAITITCGLTISVFSREILMIITAPSYYSASKIIPVLLLAVIFSRLYIFAPGLSIAKKTGISSVLNILAAFTNTILNLIFIPFMGIIGAAVATLIGNIFLFLGYSFLGNRYYSVPIKWIPIILSLCLAILVAVFFNRDSIEITWLNIVIKVISIIFMFLFLIFFGVIKKKDLSGLNKLLFPKRKKHL